MMKFHRNLHRLVWGTEEWVLSAHRSSPSIVAGGLDDGRAFSEVRPDFPLLLKVIDAHDRLSVQVHPNNANAALTGGEPKTEMWYMLEDGVIFAGLRPGTDAAALRCAIAEGRAEDVLVRHEAKRGEAYFIPGGLVHAIGDGARIFEVQQSSDTTYRLYDWGRKGADGRPRELHLEESLATIDFKLGAPSPVSEIRCPYFHFRTLDARDGARVQAPADSFLAVYETQSGAMTLLERGESMAVAGMVLLTGAPPPTVS